MDQPALTPMDQFWPQHFRQLVVTNSRYWLRYAQQSPQTLRQEIPQVVHGLTYALVLPEAWSSARDLIIYLSPTMIRQGQGKSWEEILLKAINASDVANDDEAEVELRLQLGHLYRLQGRLVEARNCLQIALQLCYPDQTSNFYWIILTQLALVARLLTDHDEALDHCQKIFTNANIPSALIAEALNVKGLVAYDRRQWATALKAFNQALVLYRSAGETYEIARILTNRGMVFQREERWAEAEASYQKAIQHFQNTDDHTEQFKAVMNLGNIFLMKQAYEIAIHHYQKALPVFQECNYLFDLASIYNNLGMAYTGSSQWSMAEDYFKASVEIWRNLEDKGYYLANVLNNFGKMLMAAKQQESAVAVLNEALHLLKTVPGTPANNRLQQKVQERLAKLNDYSAYKKNSRAGKPYC